MNAQDAYKLSQESISSGDVCLDKYFAAIELEAKKGKTFLRVEEFILGELTPAKQFALRNLGYDVTYLPVSNLNMISWNKYDKR